MTNLIREYDELCGKIRDCLMRNAGERLDANEVKVLAPSLATGMPGGVVMGMHPPVFLKKVMLSAVGYRKRVANS